MCTHKHFLTPTLFFLCFLSTFLNHWLLFCRVVIVSHTHTHTLTQFYSLHIIVCLLLLHTFTLCLWQFYLSCSIRQVLHSSLFLPHCWTTIFSKKFIFLNMLTLSFFIDLRLCSLCSHLARLLFWRENCHFLLYLMLKLHQLTLYCNMCLAAIKFIFTKCAFLFGDFIFQCVYCTQDFSFLHIVYLVL